MVSQPFWQSLRDFIWVLHDAASCQRCPSQPAMTRPNFHTCVHVSIVVAIHIQNLMLQKQFISAYFFCHSHVSTRHWQLPASKLILCYKTLTNRDEKHQYWLNERQKQGSDRTNEHFILHFLRTKHLLPSPRMHFICRSFPRKQIHMMLWCWSSQRTAGFTYGKSNNVIGAETNVIELWLTEWHYRQG